MPLFEYERFGVGEVLNPQLPENKAEVSFSRVECSVPSRLGTFLVWPSRFLTPKEHCLYDVGLIDFSIASYTKAEVGVIGGNNIIIDSKVERPAIALHAAEIIRKGAGMEKIGLYVNVQNEFSHKHLGLASTSAIQHSVAYATNEIFGRPFTNSQLIRYLPMNYGEEGKDGDDLVVEPSTGGVGAVSLNNGGMVVLGDNIEVLGHMRIPENLVYVMGIPRVNRENYVVEMEEIFKEVFSFYCELDKKWGKFKEMVIKDELLPAMRSNDIYTAGKIVLNYTLNRYGDIQKSFNLLCPGIQMGEKMNSLACLENNDKIVTAFVSSVGPNIIILTSDPNLAESHLRKIGIEDIYYFKPDNKGASFVYDNI